MAVEKEIRGVSGLLSLLLLIAVLVGAIGALSGAFTDPLVHYGLGPGWRALLAIVVIAADLLCFAGLTVVNPNQARVVTLFGVYQGTIKQPGLWWVNPFTARRRLS